MANLPVNPNAISTILRQLLTTDSVHADVLNPLFNQLLNNDASFLRRIKGISTDIMEYNGADNGATDNLLAFQNARTAVGSTGIVYFPAGTFYFAGTRPDLTGCYIAAHPSAVLKMDQNPNTKELKLLTQVTFLNGTSTFIKRPPNQFYDTNFYERARNLVARSNYNEKYRRLTWGTDFIGRSSGGWDYITNADAAISGDVLTYPGAFAAGLKGMCRAINPGEYMEATFNKPNATAVSKYLSVSVKERDTLTLFTHSPGNGMHTRLDFNFIAGHAGEVITTVLNLTGNNTAAYALAHNSSITLGIRNVDGKTIEYYINAKLVSTKTYPNFIEEVGFWVPNTDNAKYEILDPILVVSLDNSNFTPKKIASFGDSITYGAWSTFDYPHLLADLLAYSQGIGDCSVDNYAISGASSSSQLAVMQGVNLANYNYVTILIGTNDVQGDVPVATFIANVTSMIALCTAAGATPIIGMFPVWTLVAAGNNTYLNTAKYISALKKYCIDNNIKIANVRGNFGDNLQWLYDKIHPNEAGMLPVARAFMNAIISINTEKDRNLSLAPVMQKVGDRVILYDTTAPTTGSWKLWDTIMNSQPTAGAPLGWVCTTAGKPGTWAPFGTIGLTQTTLQADTTAADLAALKVDFNALLAKLKTANIMKSV